MDQYVGQIIIFAGIFAPVGWLFCDGSIVSIDEYDILYSLIGNTYGGDGNTNFALPDLRSRAPIHVGQASRGYNYPLALVGGAEGVTLALGQLPAHTHVLMATSAEGDTRNPSNAIFAKEAVNVTAPYSSTASADKTLKSGTSAVGGNQSHENRPPFLAMNYIIATEGVYPSQS